MRAPSRIFSLRGLVMLAVAVVAVLCGIDAGSVALTQLGLADDARAAGYTATELVGNTTPSQALAVAALEAARKEARTQGLTVRRQGFTIYPGGHVTLTATKEAPTLLFGRIGALRHFTEVRTTVSVEPLPYS
jgi:hypothetical protein